MNTSLIEQEIKNIQTELEVITRILQKKNKGPLDAIEFRALLCHLAHYTMVWKKY